MLLYLGASPGADGERNYTVYLYKIMNGYKDGIEVTERKFILKFWENFSILVYSLFNQEKTPKRRQKYMKKFKISLIKIQNNSRKS